jgi:hypothetical protein
MPAKSTETEAHMLTYMEGHDEYGYAYDKNILEKQIREAPENNATNLNDLLAKNKLMVDLNNKYTAWSVETDTAKKNKMLQDALTAFSKIGPKYSVVSD